MMGMAGMCAGFALVLMLGLIDRRLRHVDEVKVRLSLDRVLGMLPTLPQDLADPEAAAMAAHAVHHIRAMLQIRAGAHDSPAFAITGPVAGAGKTSLTLGLGLSFASSGSRTLLIDLDIIGGGLTSRTQSIVRKKLGRILIDRGLLSEAQLRKALQLPGEPGVRLGQRLVELGYVTPAAVDTALHMQASPSLGVLELLQGAPLERCIMETGIPNLLMMPLGGALPQHAASLSPATVSAMLREAKKRFDTILIDTGPTPGSLEASVVAAQADGVVVVVSRGHSSREVERCLHQLKAVAAPVAGVVFNRALDRDLLISQTATRLSSARRASSAAPAAMVDPLDQRGDFGPVANAVASSGARSPLGSRPFDVPAEGKREGGKS
jgi:Mrp family chromosome partitioning ATPase